jgi:hypothetical protein
VTARTIGVAAGLYLVVAVGSLAVGVTYLATPTFMPYHEVALGRSWGALDADLRTLLGALIDIAGAGLIALGLAVGGLVAVPLRRGERWARWLVPALLLTVHAPTLAATLEVLDATPATPPWYAAFAACLVTLAACAVDRPWRAAHA